MFPVIVPTFSLRVTLDAIPVAQPLSAMEQVASDSFVANLEMVGKEVVYARPNKLSRLIYGVVDKFDPLEPEQVDGLTPISEADLYVSCDPTVGVAQPAKGDRVELDNAKWTVANVPRREAGSFQCRLRRSDKTEKTADGFRVRRV